MTREGRLTFWLVAALLGVTAYQELGSSLWHDEAGTWWMVKDGLLEAGSRALWWSATSPLYYTVIWAVVQVFGLSEVAVRIPSIVFSVGTAAILYKLGQRWLDAEGAALGVLFFFCLPAVQFTVTDARPYALGLLLLVGAWLAMMRWLENDRWRDGAAFILCAAGVVWAHYTLASGLLPLAWYGWRLGWRRAGVAATGISVLLAPLGAQIVDTLGRREELIFALPPGPFTFIFTLVPMHVLVLLLLGAIAATSLSRGSGEDFKAHEAKQSLVPLALWAAVPPTLLLVLSRMGVMELFYPRYLLSKEAGMALLAAWLIRGLAGVRVRQATAVAAVVLVVPWNASFTYRHTDAKWRESSEWVNGEVRAHPQTQAAVVSMFVESLQPELLNDPAYREILMAPQTVYPVRGEPILLPGGVTFRRLPNEEAVRKLRKEVVPAAERTGRIVVVGEKLGNWYKKRLAESLEGTGLWLTDQRRFGSVSGLLYERSGGADRVGS